MWILGTAGRVRFAVRIAQIPGILRAPGQGYSAWRKSSQPLLRLLRTRCERYLLPPVVTFCATLNPFAPVSTIE